MLRTTPKTHTRFSHWLRWRPGRRPTTLALLVVLLLAGSGLSSPTVLVAQEQQTEETVYRIETTNGNVVIGTLISETETEIVIDARQLGRLTLQRDDIVHMEEVPPDRLQDGEYWFQNPQSTRYFFAPNAIGIPEGEGYYQNTWILLNNVNFAVSNNFSLGFGMVPIFLFGANAFPVWVLPKASVSLPSQNVHFAGGAVLGGVLAEDGEAVGVVYGSSTVGSRDHNATLSLGYGYTGEGFSNAPVVNVSGMRRIGQKTYLVSENYFFPGSEATGVISFGLRWAPENFAVDFALFRPLEDTDSFIAFPWLGVTIPFGQ